MSISLRIPQTQVLTKKINKKMIQGGSLYPTSWVHLGVNLARSLLSRSLRAMNSFNSTGSTRGDAVGAMRDECPSIPENGRRFPIPRIGREGEQPVSVVAVDRAVGETPRRKGASRNWSSGSDHAKRRLPKQLAEEVDDLQVRSRQETSMSFTERPTLNVSGINLSCAATEPEHQSCSAAIMQPSTQFRGGNLSSVE